MEFMPADRLAAEMHFATARENLRALVALVPVRGPDVPPGMVGAAVAIAAGALDGVAHALDANAADAARVDCPFCKGRVMRGATLCGSCWRKLDAPRGS